MRPVGLGAQVQGVPLFEALDQEVELGLKSRARLVLVEGLEEGIVLVVADARAWSRSASRSASVVLPTRMGPSMAMKRGGFAGLVMVHHFIESLGHVNDIAR